LGGLSVEKDSWVASRFADTGCQGSVDQAKREEPRRKTADLLMGHILNARGRCMMPEESKVQRRQKVIEVLNKARAMELHAIAQYMNQHYNLDDMDYGDMAAKVKLIAIDEMRHAEMFAERIKELGGEPTTEPGAKAEKGQPVDAIFPFDAKLEDDTIEAYNQFLLLCRENGDSGSVKIFEAIIDEEQIHFNYFDNVSSHIERLGQAYLAQVAGTPSETGLQTAGFVARQGVGGAKAGA
jgi:bacterioferritin